MPKRTKTTERAGAERPNRPLAGITVLDLGQIYQGPYATFLMAKAGANVIKIEPPSGEPARNRAKIAKGATLPVAMLNSNKRGLSLNLKSARGRDILKALVPKADILLENFAPGVMDRLGVGYEVLSGINPRLIYASGTGYGLSGPDRDGLAMDLTVQAASGIMSITGEPDGPPLKAGPAIVDFLSGIHLYGAVMTALYERTITGRGRLVEVAMQEAVYPTLASNLGYVYNTQGKTARVGNRHGTMAIAPYNVYPAKDGHVAIITVVEDHWTGLVEAMGREDLKRDPRFQSNQKRVEHMDETDRLVALWTRGLSRYEAAAILRRHGVPCAAVRDLIEVMNDPHMHARGMLEWIEHPELGRIVVPGSPLRFHGADPVPTTPSPRVGENSAEVLSEMLGLSAAEVAALARDGVV
jgi:crotonobetainyl-CoA:carnitine CoA-transferase CaiB-like acyl-CoA transferase